MHVPQPGLILHLLRRAAVPERGRGAEPLRAGRERRDRHLGQDRQAGHGAQEDRHALGHVLRLERETDAAPRTTANRRSSSIAGPTAGSSPSSRCRTSLRTRRPASSAWRSPRRTIRPGPTTSTTTLSTRSSTTTRSSAPGSTAIYASFNLYSATGLARHRRLRLRPHQPGQRRGSDAAVLLDPSPGLRRPAGDQRRGGAAPERRTPALFHVIRRHRPRGKLNLWTLHADFTTPANSTLTGPTAIPVDTFSPTCGGSGTTGTPAACVPQPSPGNALAPVSDRLMPPLVYRNFGWHESLVANHSVVAGAAGGVRWYEVRSPFGTPALYQQGTYAPADGSWRFMGSLGEDGGGNIALGFTLSSTTSNPSVAWTGRLASDPAGTMGQGESGARGRRRRRDRHDLDRRHGEPLGRLEQHVARPGGRLHVLVHQRALSGERRLQLGHPHRRVQVPGLRRQRFLAGLQAGAAVGAPGIVRRLHDHHDRDQRERRGDRLRHSRGCGPA